MEGTVPPLTTSASSSDSVEVEGPSPATPSPHEASTASSPPISSSATQTYDSPATFRHPTAEGVPRLCSSQQEEEEEEGVAHGVSSGGPAAATAERAGVHFSPSTTTTTPTATRPPPPLSAGSRRAAKRVSCGGGGPSFSPTGRAQKRWWPQYRRKHHTSLDYFQRDPHEESGLLAHTKEWYQELLRSNRARHVDRAIDTEVSRVEAAVMMESAEEEWLVTEAARRATAGQPAPPPAPEPSRLSGLTSWLHATSNAALLKIWILVLMVISGSAMQVVFLNFWLRQYPADGVPGNYTSFAVSSILFAVFFLLTLAVHLVMERPSLRFLHSARGWYLLFVVGAADMVCSALTIYAASHTPEVLQALFTSLVPVVTAGFQKTILKDPRNYLDCCPMTSFVCIIVGVLVAASYTVLHPSTDPEVDVGVSHASKVAWSALFCFSVIPSVLQNVAQTDYMISFTKDPLFEKWVIEQHAMATARLVSEMEAKEKEEEEEESGVVAATQPVFQGDPDEGKLSLTTPPSSSAITKPSGQVRKGGEESSGSSAFKNAEERAGVDAEAGENVMSTTPATAHKADGDNGNDGKEEEGGVEGAAQLAQCGEGTHPTAKPPATVRSCSPLPTWEAPTIAIDSAPHRHRHHERPSPLLDGDSALRPRLTTTQAPTAATSSPLTSPFPLSAVSSTSSFTHRPSAPPPRLANGAAPFLMPSPSLLQRSLRSPPPPEALGVATGGGASHAPPGSTRTSFSSAAGGARPPLPPSSANANNTNAQSMPGPASWTGSFALSRPQQRGLEAEAFVTPWPPPQLSSSSPSPAAPPVVVVKHSVRRSPAVQPLTSPSATAHTTTVTFADDEGGSSAGTAQTAAPGLASLAPTTATAPAGGGSPKVSVSRSRFRSSVGMPKNRTARHRQQFYGTFAQSIAANSATSEFSATRAPPPCGGLPAAPSLRSPLAPSSTILCPVLVETRSGVSFRDDQRHDKHASSTRLSVGVADKDRSSVVTPLSQHLLRHRSRHDGDAAGSSAGNSSRSSGGDSSQHALLRSSSFADDGAVEYRHTTRKPPGPTSLRKVHAPRRTGHHDVGFVLVSSPIVQSSTIPPLPERYVSEEEVDDAHNAAVALPSLSRQSLPPPPPQTSTPNDTTSLLPPSRTRRRVAQGGEQDDRVSSLSDDADAASNASSSSSSLYSSAAGDDVAHIHVAYSAAQGDDLTVKLILLAADTTIQAILTLALLPADALPWWGGSPSVPAAWNNFRSGVDCLLYCKDNLLYCMLYCAGFVLTYVGSAYLDHYSVTLCSMVSQLASPTTALLLIIFPRLNLTGDYTPWYLSAVAITLLSAGALLYTFWDQQTSELKEEGEHVVKAEFVKPRVVVVIPEDPATN